MTGNSLQDPEWGCSCCSLLAHSLSSFRPSLTSVAETLALQVTMRFELVTAFCTELLSVSDALTLYCIASCLKAGEILGYKD